MCSWLPPSPSCFLNTRYPPSHSKIDDLEHVDFNQIELKTDQVTSRLTEPTLFALRKMGIDNLFPIQLVSFPFIINNRDFIGRAKTGTGKTLAFALPVIESILKEGPEPSKLPRVLVLTPTRELAQQVAGEFSKLGNDLIGSTAVFGGTPIQRQIYELRRGPDVVIGTPGRVLDLIGSGWLRVEKLRTIVLDEADHMLDRGFSQDLDLILSYVMKGREGEKLQYLMFSATMPEWALSMIKKYMEKPVYADITKSERIAVLNPRTGEYEMPQDDPMIPSTVKLSYIKTPETSLLTERINHLHAILAHFSFQKSIVFVKRKVDVMSIQNDPRFNKMAGFLYGDCTQAQRDLTLSHFKNGSFPVLVATDVASRGLDIPSVEFVFHLSPPDNVESFVHRSGRCGRAGKSGEAITIVMPSEMSRVSEIEKFIKARIRATSQPIDFSSKVEFEPSAEYSNGPPPWNSPSMSFPRQRYDNQSRGGGGGRGGYNNGARTSGRYENNSASGSRNYRSNDGSGSGSGRYGNSDRDPSYGNSGGNNRYGGSGSGSGRYGNSDRDSSYSSGSGNKYGGSSSSRYGNSGSSNRYASSENSEPRKKAYDSQRHRESHQDYE